MRRTGPALPCRLAALAMFRDSLSRFFVKRSIMQIIGQAFSLASDDLLLLTKKSSNRRPRANAIHLLRKHLRQLVPSCRVAWAPVVGACGCHLCEIPADSICIVSRPKQKRKFKATTNSRHAFPVAENLLNQTFAPTRPNEAWVTDITYVMTDEGWLYLAGVKDVFTCELVGYAMGPRMTQDLTAQALWRPVRSKRPAPGLIHHSDRGTQYCADDYRKLVAQFGMQASMSRKGNSYDNAPMESFWGSLKNEMIHHQRYAMRANAESAIKEYIEIFYNRPRRHSRLG